MLFTSPPYADLRCYGGVELDVAYLSQFIPAWKPYVEYQAVNVGLIRRNFEIVEWWNPYIDAAHIAGLKLLAWNVWDKKCVGSIGNQSALIPIRHEWIFVFGEKYRELNKTWDKVPDSIRDYVRKSSRRQADDSIKKEYKRYLSCPYKRMESVVSVISERGPIREKHPAVFPIALPMEYIRCFTNPGDAVVDCFAGSGTTAIAAERCGRNACIMELNPDYCDIAIDRLKKEMKLKND